MRKADYEDDLARRIAGSPWLPTPERQFYFAKSVGRKHRFDFAWPEHKLAVEVDGGTIMARKGVAVGHHSSLRDYRKRNLAVLLGWRVLAYRPESIRSGDVIFDLTWLLGGAPDLESLKAREERNLAHESAARRIKNLKLGAKRRGR